jgi:hypothetical protein
LSEKEGEEKNVINLIGDCRRSGMEERNKNEKRKKKGIGTGGSTNCRWIKQAGAGLMDELSNSKKKSGEENLLIEKERKKKRG